MDKLVLSDDKKLNKNYAIIKSPVSILVKNNVLLPCSEFFIDVLRKKGYSGSLSGNNHKSCDTIIFSLIQSKDEQFFVEIEKESSCTIVKFSGTEISCYYAVQAFFQESKINDKNIFTKLKFQKGQTKNHHRNLIISLSWMENLIEFPFYDFERWKEFIDLVSELRFHRIDFMQWGCTIPSPPQQDKNVDDEWELWQSQEKTTIAWSLPVAYRGLKFQQDGWQKRHLLQPWLFPIKGKTISNSHLFSVCYPPEKQIPLAFWDNFKQKLVRKLWRPPFIQDEKLFRKITDLIHSRGMKTGLFTTPRVPCVKDENGFIEYWKEVIQFFVDQGIDDFVFETEEGPVSFEHHSQCELCHKAFGDIFSGYSKKVAHQVSILNEVVKNCSKNSEIGWILHVPLNGGYGNPPERKEWLKNPENYVENLKVFKKFAPENFTFDYVPFPGEHGITHDFLPRIYFEIFGYNRFRQTGYTHAWGPTRAFTGLEPYYIETARKLWEFVPEKGNLWKPDIISKKSMTILSLKLYGSKRVLSDLARYSINNRRITYGIKSAVCPYVWDRSKFSIYQDVLKKMFESASKRNKISFLPFPKYHYKNLLSKVIRAENRLKTVKIQKSLLSCNWNFKNGFDERYALVKATKWAIEFLLLYDEVLVKFSKEKKIKSSDIKKLIKIGLLINKESSSGQKTSFWPSSSRLGGLYDYYAFALLLYHHFSCK